MKKVVCVFSITMVLLLSSCVTMKPGEQDLPRPEMTSQNEVISGKLNCKNSYWAEIAIENKSDKVVTLLWDVSSFSPINGNSQRFVPEGTKYVDAKQSIPPVSIAPGSKYVKSFSSSDSFYYQSGEYGGWRDLPWIPKDLNGSKFVFGYRIGSEEGFLIFDGNESSKKMKAPPQIIGSVSYEKTFWNVLFLKSVDKRREFLLEQATKEAEKKYGNNIELTNIEYEGNWSPASILLYFSMLGFVENASITADVIQK
jgi:hypothetical protein